uniref:Uncharacterized protein n=1 Tax=Leersia perrieri TaxID=77586 RepID=A0A0D9W915_9ORYZ
MVAIALQIIPNKIPEFGMGNHIFSSDTIRQPPLIVILGVVTTTRNLLGPVIAWAMECPGEERVVIHLPQVGCLHHFQEKIMGASSSADPEQCDSLLAT